jgi:rhodanese-related sulfurtransferase
VGIFSFRRPAVPEISVDELAGLLAAGGTSLLDVREDWEFRRAHVAQAIHIPLGQLDQRHAELPRDARVVVICQSGSRSVGATAFLLAQGYQGSASVAGGTTAWIRSGRPVEPADLSGQR